MERRDFLKLSAAATPGILLLDEIGWAERDGLALYPVPDKAAYEAFCYIYGRVTFDQKELRDRELTPVMLKEEMNRLTMDLTRYIFETKEWQQHLTWRRVRGEA